MVAVQSRCSRGVIAGPFAFGGTLAVVITAGTLRRLHVAPFAAVDADLDAARGLALRCVRY